MVRLSCHNKRRTLIGIGEKMKKNILIVGPGRVGKTTLAKMLNEELKYSIVWTDEIILAFERVYPQLEINHSNFYGKTASNFAPFIAHYLGAMSYRSTFKNGIKFVVEGAYFDFEKVMPEMERMEFKDEFMFIGLVYNNKSIEELFSDIKKYDTEEDWTYNCSDEELKEHCKICIESSRFFFDKFKEHNFLIYDVSTEREKTLSKIVDDIKKQFCVVKA